MNTTMPCIICGSTMLAIDGKDVDNGARCLDCGTGAGKKITHRFVIGPNGEILDEDPPR